MVVEPVGDGPDGKTEFFGQELDGGRRRIRIHGEGQSKGLLLFFTEEDPGLLGRRTRPTTASHLTATGTVVEGGTGKEATGSEGIVNGVSTRILSLSWIEGTVKSANPSKSLPPPPSLSSDCPPPPPPPVLLRLLASLRSFFQRLEFLNVLGVS